MKILLFFSSLFAVLILSAQKSDIEQLYKKIEILTAESEFEKIPPYLDKACELYLKSINKTKTSNPFRLIVQRTTAKDSSKVEHLLNNYINQYPNDTIKLLAINGLSVLHNASPYKKRIAIQYQIIHFLEEKKIFPEDIPIHKIQLANNYMALQNYQEAISIIEKISLEDLEGVSKIETLNSMGLMVIETPKKKEALHRFSEAMKEAYKIKDTFSFGLINSSIALYYTNGVNQKDSAIFYTRKAIKGFSDAGYPQYTAGLYSNLAKLQNDQDSPDSSYHNFKKAYTIADKYGFTYELYNIGKELGLLEIKQGNFENANTYCSEALKLSPNYQTLNFKKDCYSCLSKSFEKLGIYDSALYYAKLYNDYEDSIFNLEDIQNIKNFEDNYEKMQLLSEQKIKDAQNNLRLEKAQRKNQTYLLFGLVLLLLLILVSSIYYLNQRSKKIILKEKDYLDSLLHNLVHEFRTPLTLIKGPVNELLKEDDQNELLKIVDRNSSQMLELVNQVLDFAKIKAGKLEVKNETTNLPVFIQDTIEVFKPYAQQKNIEIQLENKLKKPLMGVDSDKLYKILSNLVSNAIKYGKENGTITISLNGEAGVLKIDVIDDGVGISESDQKKVFDKFYQVDATSTRKGEGTGLGLAFVKELIELLNGEITLKSKPNHGSTFSIMIPVYPLANHLATSLEKDVNNEIKSQENIKENSDTKGMILIIEDNKDMRDYLGFLLQDTYDLNYAENGEIGVKKALELIPDLIISDVMMPEKDGYQVLKELKSNTISDHIPIIMLTAKASFDSKIKGLQFGADGYLSKPFSSVELLHTVENQFNFLNQLWKKYQNQDGEDTLANPKKTEPEFLKKLKGVISKQLDEKLTADQLSEQMNLSRSQLHRKLKGLTGQSLSEFVNSYKIQQAFEDLNKGELNVSEIAHKYGYSDAAYFSRLFKKVYHKSPSEVKNK